MNKKYLIIPVLWGITLLSSFCLFAQGSISGATSVCYNASTQYTYTANGSAATTGYTWVLPSNMVLVSGGGTNAILVRFNAASLGKTLSVSGNGVSASVTIDTYSPPTGTGNIVGTSTLCPPGQSGVNYTLSGMGNIASYSWFVTNGATITSGSATSSILVTFPTGYTSGLVGITPANGACIASTITKNIYGITAVPTAAGSITGSTIVCPLMNGVTYSIPAIATATGYVWTLPAGASIASGTNTNSITVNFSGSAVSGNVSVYGTNCIGNGTSSSLGISTQLLPGQAGIITGNSEVCPGSSGTYSIQPISGATGYTWSVPSGASIVSGNNTTSISVSFTGSAANGTISVVGTNCNGNGASSSIPLLADIKIDAPNAAHSVDLVTGTLSVNVPIAAVTDGNVQVPISLMYSGMGVKVTDDDGLVGHNWNVSANSYGVFRQVRELPDDYSFQNAPGAPDPDNRKGWLFSSTKTSIQTFTPNTDNNATTCSDEVVNYSFLNGLSFDADTEPDMFSVSAPGLSFDFYFDENNVAHTVPFQDVIITPYTAAGILTSASTSGPITYFTVVDTRGMIYEFRELESMTEDMFEKNQYVFVRKTNQQDRPFTYTTSWRLSKMSSPVYGAVDFTYKSITIQDNSNFVPYHYRRGTKRYTMHKYNYPVITSNQYGAGGTIAYQRSFSIKQIKTVVSPVTEVEFVSLPKEAGTLMERLSSIKVYDKLTGVKTLIQEFLPGYSVSGKRAFLTSLIKKISCAQGLYTFEYNSTSLPAYDSKEVDDWEYYKILNPHSTSYQYDETAAFGSLRKINQPLKGYSVFFYETHDYWDGTSDIQGGGIRIKKIISYDGTSSDNDFVQDYIYKTESGNSSGKLQHKASTQFSVARQQSLNLPSGTVAAPRYQEVRTLFPANPESWCNELFQLKGDQDLSYSSSLHGSAVAYERVTVQTKDAGKSVYEYELPASYGETSANGNEWTASKVLIARPSTGTSSCYATPNIQEGFLQYPFPVNSNYDFAKGLLRKITDYNEANVKVREVQYTYKRLYAATSTRKIYGLSLEQLPTYYHNGTAYVDSKMFLYSKYAILTDVKTVPEQQIETIYNSTDLVQKSEQTTNYFYTSPAHRELSRMEVTNSDGTISAVSYKYVTDFTIGTPSDAKTTALKSLINAHRVELVETISSKVTSGVEKYSSASLTIFQTIGNKIYPFQLYSYASPDGNGGFVPSSMSGSTTFTYDQTRYTLDNTFLSADSYGNLTERSGKDRTMGGTAFGYFGSLPVISVSNARLGEVRFSNFETPVGTDFTPTWSTVTYSAGRSTSKALDLPVGTESANRLQNGLSYSGAQFYIFSCWLKAATAGTLNIKVYTTAASQLYTIGFSASTDWKYYSLRLPVGSIVGTGTQFDLSIWSSAGASLEDAAFFPEHASVVSTTYAIPFGKSSETDSRGTTFFYEYDIAGRLKIVYDRDRNILKKIDYKVRP